MENGRLKINWKSLAKNRIKRIDKWYRKNMGNRSADKFSFGIIETVELLASNPYMGKPEPSRAGCKKDYRSFVEHKNHKIIYYVEKGIIHIADIWPNSQNPEDLNKRLK